MLFRFALEPPVRDACAPGPGARKGLSRSRESRLHSAQLVSQFQLANRPPRRPPPALFQHPEPPAWEIPPPVLSGFSRIPRSRALPLQPPSGLVPVGALLLPVAPPRGRPQCPANPAVNTAV